MLRQAVYTVTIVLYKINLDGLLPLGLIKKDAMEQRRIGIVPHILNLGIRGELRFHAPATVPRGDSSVAHWTGGVVGRKACVDALKRKISCRESNPSSYVAQSVAEPAYRLAYRYKH